MSKLRDLQRDFSAAMRGDSEGVVAHIDGGALGAQSRLGIYRNAIAATRLRTLSESFPTVRALVGDAFFEQLAHRYAALHPSRSGNLCDYGEHFAAFIEGSPEAMQPVPYLADVARLEWLRQQAALAAEAKPRRLRTVGGNERGLRARFHPSVGAMRSEFPLFTLYRWCEAPTDPAPRLEDGPECGLIWRAGAEVVQSAIHPASYAFAHALLQGGTIAAAGAAGNSQDDDFDPDECLRSLIECGIIVGFTPTARSS
jgi:hypothetical protein